MFATRFVVGSADRHLERLGMGAVWNRPRVRIARAADPLTARENVQRPMRREWCRLDDGVASASVG
jgi:hypothetical protein